MIFAGSWWPRCKMQAVQSGRLRLCQVEMCSQVSANLGFWDKTCNVRYRSNIANANCFNNFWFNRIGKNTPSPLAIAENANVLARFVAFDILLALSQIVRIAFTSIVSLFLSKKAKVGYSHLVTKQTLYLRYAATCQAAGIVPIVEPEVTHPLLLKWLNWYWC